MSESGRYVHFAALSGLQAAVERQLFNALGTQPQHIDILLRRANVATGAALETLLDLELRGLIEQCPGWRFRRLDAGI